MDIDNINNDFAVASTSTIQVKEKNLKSQFDDLHTAVEVKVIKLKTNKENTDISLQKKIDKIFKIQWQCEE